MRRCVLVLAGVLLLAVSAHAQTPPMVTINGVNWVPNLGFSPTTQPGTSTEGLVYYDSATHALKFYNGTTWGAVGSTISSGSCAVGVGVQSISSTGVVTCWNGTTFAATTGPHTIAGADNASSLIFPTVTYTSNMSALPIISLTATVNTAAGTQDFLKMAITRTAGNYNFVNFLGGAAGATRIFTISGNAGTLGQITVGGPQAEITADGAGATLFFTGGPFQTQGSYPANNAFLYSVGTRATSNTGANASSAFDLAHTLNTSGVPSVFKLAVTDTAHGVGTKIIDILGGAAGTTSLFKLTLDTAAPSATATALFTGTVQASAASPAFQGDQIVGYSGHNVGIGAVFTVVDNVGNISKYNNITTAGAGVPPIYGSYSTTGNTGAVTNAINYTPPATAGTYRISGLVNVTAWTTPASFVATCSYTDAIGTARTDTAFFHRGSTGATAAAVTAIDRWYFAFEQVAINNAAAAITCSTSGTFTGSPVYTLQLTLEQVR